MWTLPKYRPIEIKQPTAELRDLVRAGVMRPNDPDLRPNTTVTIAMSSTPPSQRSARTFDRQRRAQVVNVITGDVRTAQDNVALGPAEILIVRRVPLPAPLNARERARRASVVGPNIVPADAQFDAQFDELIRIYVNVLWDTDERRGMLEVARDAILSAPTDDMPISAQLLAIDALPFGHALFTALMTAERQLLAKVRRL